MSVHVSEAMLTENSHLLPAILQAISACCGRLCPACNCCGLGVALHSHVCTQAGRTEGQLAFWMRQQGVLRALLGKSLLRKAMTASVLRAYSGLPVFRLVWMSSSCSVPNSDRMLALCVQAGFLRVHGNG